MNCYIISYDLRTHPSPNYERLYEAIKSYEKWAHINESVWAVVTIKNSVEIRDHLFNYIDRNDRIFVVKSGIEAAWKNSICRPEWLKDNL